MPIPKCTPEVFAKRFWSRVDRSSDQSSCWNWKGNRIRNGYGRIFRDGRDQLAHRTAWELANEQVIPEGLCACHKCDNPRCCNPSHIFIGTVAENNADKTLKGRSPFGERNGSCKLSEDQVCEIRRLSADGLSMRKIAKRFGVSQVLIFKIIHRMIWPTENGFTNK